MSTRRIEIILAKDRNVEGQIAIKDLYGHVISGPFAVCGRAADTIAAQHNNPLRNPLLPYGDPPTGLYRINGIKKTTLAEGLRSDLYGRGGAIALLPWDGDAALADAVGRFEILIHGGAPSETGGLRVTSGHFRVSNAALISLKAALEQSDAPQWVICTEEGSNLDAQDPTLVDRGWSRTSPITPPNRKPLAVTFGEYSPTDDSEFVTGQVKVDPQSDTSTIIELAGKELLSAARDLGLDTLDTYGGKPIPNEALPWTESAAKLAGGLVGAGELLNDGNKEAAYAAAKETILAVIPDIAGVIAVDVAAPTLVEATIVVGVSTAVAGMTLPAAAILVSATVVTVGVAAAVGLGTKKLAEFCIETIKQN